jgi:hypothetical protein
MKKLLLLSCMFIASFFKVSAYTTVPVQDSISTNTHWTCDKQYLLKGYVYVTAGATLTIDAGTIIRGDKDTKGALVIERGAKIIAIGTAASPIVFTSNQAAGDRTFGDWGGVIICGNAPVNWNAGEAKVEGGPRSFYGGTDPHDNSGTMQYVRIEFGGIAFSPNNEVNSLTFCGVGDATTIDHIQCSYNGDDAYEFFGGTVNTHHMVAFRTWDDDFDTDNGYQGKNQFIAVVRDPYVADLSGSKAFESDSYLAGTYSGVPVDNTKINKSIFSNCTVIGPIINPASVGAFDGNYVAGVHIRRGSAMSILNSVISSFPCGVLIDESAFSGTVYTYGSTVANIGSNELQFRNNIVCGTLSASTPSNKDVIFVKDGARSLTPTTSFSDTTSTGTDWSVLAGYPGPITWLKNSSFGNKTYASEQASVLLGNPFNLSNPNLVPNSTSPICYAAAHGTPATYPLAHAFNPAMAINYDTTGGWANYNVPVVPPDFSSSSKASDAFFTPVNYIGAFAGTGATSDNWMKGWCEFNPNDADYEQTCYVAPPPPVDNYVDRISAFEGAKVFPNPAKDKAILMLEVKKTTNLNLIVLDMTGKTVKEVFSGSVNAGNQVFEFNTSNLAIGMYVISITAENKHKTLKFSVAK